MNQLLLELKQEMNLSILLISHDIALVSSICENILVMNEGKIVERGSAEQVLGAPQSDYTGRLLQAILQV